MTNKSTSFKRIALALVAALGFGALSSTSSSAYQSAATSTLSLSASSVSVAAGETATVSVTLAFTSTLAHESLTVLVAPKGGTFTEQIRGLTTDSINVRTGLTNVGAFQVLSSTANTPISMSGATDSMHVSSATNSATPTFVQAKFNFDVRTTSSSPAGNQFYTLSLVKLNGNGTYDLLDTDALTVTVTAKDTVATAAKSQLFVNAALCATNRCDGALSGNGSSAKAYATEADSSLVVSAGAPATGGTQSFTAAGYMFGVFRNAADTVTVTGTDVTGTMTVSITGPGALTKSGATTGQAKSLTISNSGETITIWSDGTAGTATITGYIGTTALTQAAKTVVFTGRAATITASETTVVSRNGAGTPLSSTAADSITVGTNLVTFTAKDSAGNTVTSLASNSKGTLYCVSSDTAVVGTGTGSTATAAFIQAVNNSSGVWGCPMVVRSAGTATITIADESIVANSAVTSSPISFTFAPKVTSTTKGRGTIAFDKSSYQIGERATITITVLNSTGAIPGQANVAGDEYTTAHVFPTLTQNRPFSGFGRDSAGNALGFDANRQGTTVSLTGSTFIRGVETFVVLMPTTAGQVTLTGFTTDGTNDTATAVNVSVDVVDPNAAAIAAAQAAAVAAADAATDAALEAIDAANAATDAANLAAEAADAATVAAEEARDAADAATAAVEALATEVASMMAALKAQITTLARTVAKIAKKVNA